MEQSLYTVAGIGPRIDTFLGQVIRNGGFDLQFQLTQGLHIHPDLEDPDVVVKFTGRDVELLLENRAELLLALEQIGMEVLRIPPEHHSRICFDANDHRMLRIEELRLSAATAAEKVKKSLAPFHFNPMSSRERRIIHISLRNETAVRSESTGTGSYRQVVIVPAGMPTPEPVIPPRPSPEGARSGPRTGGPGRRPGPPRR